MTLPLAGTSDGGGEGSALRRGPRRPTSHAPVTGCDGRVSNSRRGLARVLAVLTSIIAGARGAKTASACPLAACIPFVTLAMALLVSAGCSTAKIGYSFPSASWPTEGGDFRRTGALGAEAHPPFALRWRVNAGIGPAGHLAILEDAVAGCFLRRTVAAYSLDSGEALWKRNLRTDPASGPSAAAGLMFISTDIPEGRVQCINLRNGRTRWWADTGETSGAPTVLGDCVYACARNGMLFKLEMRDGKVRWSRRIAKLAGSSPAVTEDVILLTTLGDSVVAVSTDSGKVRWRRFVGAAQFGAASVWNGRSYLSTNDGQAVCLDVTTGEELWRAPLGGRCMSNAAVREGAVYFTDLSGQLSCLSAATGELSWKTKEDGPFMAAPTASSLYVYTAGMGGRVSCYDRETGDLLWTEVIEDSFETPPVIAEMYLVLVSSKGTVYCYKEEIR